MALQTRSRERTSSEDLDQSTGERMNTVHALRLIVGCVLCGESCSFLSRDSVDWYQTTHECLIYLGKPEFSVERIFKEVTI
jgi:hypothetical protein